MQCFVRYLVSFYIAHLRDICRDGIVYVSKTENGLMEVQQIVANQFLHEIGRHQAASTVECFRVQKTVIIGLAPDQEVIATLDRQFRFRIRVRRVLERLVTEAGYVNVTSAFARHVQHVHLTLGHNVFGIGQSVQRICQYTCRNLRHLPRTEKVMAGCGTGRGTGRGRRAGAQALLNLVDDGLLLKLIDLRLGGELLHRLQWIAYCL